MKPTKEISALDVICTRLRGELSTGGNLTKRQTTAWFALEKATVLRRALLDLYSEEPAAMLPAPATAEEAAELRPEVHDRVPCVYYRARIDRVIRDAFKEE